MANLLKEYQRKRDFKKTAEPSGKLKKSKNEKYIFVVQEHHASRLHYDFRLEVDGVLKSWAIPKGPSLDPKVKRLAVQTEDHPMEYAKFHGTIPKGEYGAGEVFIWDKGEWICKEGENPHDAFEKGRIEFRLKGKKLKGSWILIRTHYLETESKKNWLLIKTQDDKVTLGKSSGRVVKKYSQKKERKTKDDPWPEFIPPQLPKLVESPPPEDDKWVHEMKFDGYRIQAHLKNNIAELYTRRGLNWSNHFPHLLNAVQKVKARDAILDGEIVALDKNGISHFQDLQNHLQLKDDKSLCFYFFDILYLDGKDLRELPLVERKSILKKVLQGSDKKLVYCDHVEQKGNDFFEISCQHKLEGIVSKMADAPYRSGRTELWLKTKCKNRQEFVIGGYTEPKGGRSSFGSLLLGVFENGKFKYVGKVGTGFDNLTLKTLYTKLKKISQKQSPFDEKGPKVGKWVRPILVAEVSFSMWTNEGVLRTPVFVALREDKPSKEIERERAISSPDKVLFKEENITKHDVSEYYQSVYKWMLPHMKDRPLTLLRCPEGTHGTCFYQKHFIGDVPKALELISIKEDKGEGDYVSINSKRGLIELIQLNAFEIHLWNCRRDDIEHPDQIVMDLDPGNDVKWAQVIKGAFELKELLDELKIKSFVKLTGGKGIHLHIPIEPLYSWEEIKAFSRTLALEMVKRYPSHYTSNMSKAARKNKIFIDYLRNGRGATAVAPYSLRARKISSVAMPLSWTELKKVKDPQTFTLEKALLKIKRRRSDPWRDIYKFKQTIRVLDEYADAA